ncbi:type 1 glutamine amidotransferase domain-containing protein [Desulfovibrio cuneatus]|uniref:type 1 glutamine amidotransferase domain-containing protein n=1 Tax=Desulfovibrio cuneatus TaxID=159728 RepID=UPI000400CF62|nr:type 1 glutamine amidotransferase domain-containing protein [Desulfovibrio cuneatus]
MSAQAITTTPKSGKILFVITSHSKVGNTGKDTGYYLSEVAHPWAVLTKAGFTMDYVSPKGGQSTVDGFDLEDTTNAAFWNNAAERAKIEASKKPSEVNPADYEAIFFAGGHGTMWDFPENQELAAITRNIYEQGGIVSAVCHGPAGLVNVRLSNGEFLVAGKRVNSFTDDEERAVALENVVPFMLQTTLQERGAIFEHSGLFEPHVTVDQRLVTGQNPQSATAVGEAIVRLLRP